MYEVPKYKPRIRLISENGDVIEYSNFDEFLYCVDRHFLYYNIVLKFSKDPIGLLAYRFNWNTSEKQYIVRDEFGSVYSPAEIIEAYINKKNKETGKNKNKWYNKRHDFIYRRTPVPYTGKKRWNFANFYRTPKTTQEKRWNIAHKNYVRGKRRAHMLPDPWDDRVRSDIYEKRTWKRHRKTQYK